MRTGLITAALTVALVASVGGAATATKPNPDHKVPVCHKVNGEGELKNGWNSIVVDIASSGYVQGGHHGGHPGNTPNDIIPPYEYQMADGSTFNYPGQNWSAETQAFHANGCRTPIIPPPPPIDPPKPPVDKVVFAPKARIAVCGDPRVKTWMNNRFSNVPAIYRVRFIRAKDGDVRIIKRNVAPGTQKVTKWRWVKGGGTWFTVKAKPASGGTWTTLVKQRIYRGEAWGTGACIK